MTLKNLKIFLNSLLVTLNLVKLSSLFVSLFTFKYLSVKVVRGCDVRVIVVLKYFYFLVTLLE